MSESIERYEWIKDFDERQQKEIAFCLIYDTGQYRHGTQGHNDMVIIARMARLLDTYQAELERISGYTRG